MNSKNGYLETEMGEGLVDKKRGGKEKVKINGRER
jgi:hypothetical protein